MSASRTRCFVSACQNPIRGGLMALSWILFGGMRGMHSGRRHWKRRRPPYEDFAAENMTPEQREFFRRKLERRCGGGWMAEC